MPCTPTKAPTSRTASPSKGWGGAAVPIDCAGWINPHQVDAALFALASPLRNVCFSPMRDSARRSRQTSSSCSAGPLAIAPDETIGIDAETVERLLSVQARTVDVPTVAVPRIGSLTPRRHDGERRLMQSGRTRNGSKPRAA